MIKNLYDNKLANIVIGLFDPSRFGLPAWLGYKIQDETNQGLRTYGRFMYILANRDGEMGGICPLFFDGMTCTFEELPRPDDINAITKYYIKAQNLKTYKQQRKLTSLALISYIKQLINK